MPTPDDVLKAAENSGQAAFDLDGPVVLRGVFSLDNLCCVDAFLKNVFCMQKKVLNILSISII